MRKIYTLLTLLGTLFLAVPVSAHHRIQIEIVKPAAAIVQVLNIEPIYQPTRSQTIRSCEPRRRHSAWNGTTQRYRNGQRIILIRQGNRSNSAHCNVRSLRQTQSRVDHYIVHYTYRGHHGKYISQHRPNVRKNGWLKIPRGSLLPLD